MCLEQCSSRTPMYLLTLCWDIPHSKGSSPGLLQATGPEKGPREIGQMGELKLGEWGRRAKLPQTRHWRRGEKSAGFWYSERNAGSGLECSPTAHPLCLARSSSSPGSNVTSSGTPQPISCPRSLRCHSPHFSLAFFTAPMTVSLGKTPSTHLPTDRDLVPPSPQHPAHAWPRRELDKHVLKEQGLGGSSLSVGAKMASQEATWAWEGG